MSLGLDTSQKKSGRLDAREVSRELADHIEQLATEAWGEPTERSKTALRYGQHKSKSVVIAGEKRGAWHCHEERKGGGPLDLIRHTHGGSLADAVERGAAWLGHQVEISTSATVSRAEVVITTSDDPLLNVERAGVIWRETTALTGTLAEHYLTVARKVPLPPRHHEVLRFHPACPCKGKRVPALVAVMSDIASAWPVGIHRTPLLPDGSDRDRELGKLMLGQSKGAIIRLSPDDTVTDGLGICEGIESGLAVLGRGWGPVWVAGSAGAIRTFPVLPGIEALTLFSDHDSAGLEAARICAGRWRDAGREALVRAPRAAGADWNDEGRAA